MVESGWRGELELRFARHEPSLAGKGRVRAVGPDAHRSAGVTGQGGSTGEEPVTLLAHRRHTGPLVIQRPFYPEGKAVPHVYVLHPPGGLVGGDHLRLEVTAESDSHALITTPAATKVYRSAGGRASQRFRFSAESRASLEWLPQETILHDGSYVDLATEVRLAPGARFIGMDTLCFGLSARGETFASGRCRQRWEIWRGDRPLFLERGKFDAGDPVHGATWGLGGARVSGMMMMVLGLDTPRGFDTPPEFDIPPRLDRQGPESVADPSPISELLGRLRSAAAEVASPERAGVSVLGQGEVLVCRYLGGSAQGARAFFQRQWTLARPAVMGRPAVAPRIWAT